MPIKSSKQYRFMQLKAHSNSAAGPSKQVAEEMIHKTSPNDRKKFAKKLKSVK